MTQALRYARVDAMTAFMRERHQIYLNRRAGMPRSQWTTNPILAKYKFTNVYRELDRVTVWIHENWREPLANHKNLWLAMALARQINWPPTLAAIGFPYQWEPEAVLSTMRSLRNNGDKVYTGAYMLRCDIQDATTPDKPAYTVYKVINPLVVGGMGGLFSDIDSWNTLGAKEHWHGVRGNEPTLREVHEHFMHFHGWGGFLSYEVVTDLRHTRYLRNAPDINTWAFAGPGAVRGLQRLLGADDLSDVMAAMPAAMALTLMRQLLADISAHWPSGVDWPALELREIEHSLCEFDKHERVRLGQGKPRSLFTPSEP